MFLWQVFLCSLLLLVTTGTVSVVKVGEGLVRKGKQAAKTWLYQKSNQHRAQTEEKINFTEQRAQFLPGLKLLLPEMQKTWSARIQVSERLL